MKEKLPPTHSRLIGKQMRIDSLELENTKLKSYIARIVKAKGKSIPSTSAVQNASQYSSRPAQERKQLQAFQMLQEPSHSSWAPSNQLPSQAVASNHNQAPLVSPLQPPQLSALMHPHHASNTLHSQHSSWASPNQLSNQAVASNHKQVPLVSPPLQPPQLSGPMLPCHVSNAVPSQHNSHLPRALSNQLFTKAQSAGASSHKQVPFVSPSLQPPQLSGPMHPHRSQQKSHSLWAVSNQVSNQVQSAAASNNKQVPFVSPSLQPSQQSGPMQLPHISNAAHTQHQSRYVQPSGCNQMQSSHGSIHLPLQRDCSQMQSPPANNQLQSPLFPSSVHTENISTHTQVAAAPSHTSHVHVTPANDKRPSEIGTKLSVNTCRSPNSHFARAHLHAQSERLYSQKFPNVYQNGQHSSYRPPFSHQNPPLSNPWASRPQTEASNEHSSALQQGQWREYPFISPSNIQPNVSTKNQTCMPSQIQQFFSNPVNHGVTSLTSMRASQSSNPPQVQSTQYQHSTELSSNLHQVDGLTNLSVPFPSPQHLQQQQNTSIHINQSHGQMLGGKQDFGLGSPFQGNLNTRATNYTQHPLISSSSQPLISSSSQPVNDVHSSNKCLQSKKNSSENEQSNENMGLDDFLSELHSQCDMSANKWYKPPTDMRPVCDKNLSNSTQDSISVSEIIKEMENDPSNPTKCHVSTDICRKDSIHYSQSVSASLPSTVSSLSNKSFRSPPPSTLTPPLSPPEKKCSRTEVVSNYQGGGTSGSHEEKENPSVVEEILPPYSATDKSYGAKTSVMDLAVSLPNSKSTQSTIPAPETSLVSSGECTSTRHYDNNQVLSTIQSDSHSQNDPTQSPLEVSLNHDDSDLELDVVYLKTSLSTSILQTAVPGSMVSSQQVITSEVYATQQKSALSQNALFSFSSVDRPAELASMPIKLPTANTVPPVPQNNNGGSSFSTSGEAEKLLQHEAEKKPASFVSINNSSSSTLSSIVDSQPVISNFEIPILSGVTENLSAVLTMHKAQTNDSLNINSGELPVLTSSLISDSLLNDNRRKLQIKLNKHKKVNDRRKKYLDKTGKLQEGFEVFCYVCKKSVNGTNILNHLFFGYLECSRCDCKLKRCQDLKEGIKLDKLICNKSELNIHKFKHWTVNPVDFLSYQMWSKSRETCENTTPEHQIQGLSKYLQTLSCLKSLAPWSIALSRCIKYTKSMMKDLKLPLEIIEIQRKSNISLGNADNVQSLLSASKKENFLNHTTTIENASESYEKPEISIMTNVEENVDPKNDGCEIFSLSSKQIVNDEGNVECLGSVGISANEYEVKSYEVSEDEHVIASKENSDKEVIKIQEEPSDCHNTESASNSFSSDCILDASYTMDLLEEVMEYVDIDDACKDLQLKSFIPENNHCSTELCYPNCTGEVTTSQLMYKDISECDVLLDTTDLKENSNEARKDLKMDERHLIIDIDTDMGQDKQNPLSLEECPMCYEVLCPSQFTVNTECFTISTVCTECDLIISIRLKNSISEVNIRDDQHQERKRPGPKSKTKDSGIKRPRGIRT